MAERICGGAVKDIGIKREQGIWSLEIVFWIREFVRMKGPG